MMIITDCSICGKDYMYDPNQQPQYKNICQNCHDNQKNKKDEATNGKS